VPAEYDTPPRIIVDTEGIADFLDTSVSFVKKDRGGKRLIPFFRVGDLVRYDIDRVRAALQANEEGGPQLATPVRRAPAAVAVPATAVEAVPERRGRGRPRKIRSAEHVK